MERIGKAGKDLGMFNEALPILWHSYRKWCLKLRRFVFLWIQQSMWWMVPKSSINPMWLNPWFVKIILRIPVSWIWKSSANQSGTCNMTDSLVVPLSQKILVKLRNDPKYDWQSILNKHAEPTIENTVTHKHLRPPSSNEKPGAAGP